MLRSFSLQSREHRKKGGKIGEARRMGAEGESLNKCSGFGAIFASFDLILVKSIRISVTLSFQLGDKHHLLIRET